MTCCPLASHLNKMTRNVVYILLQSTDANVYIEADVIAQVDIQFTEQITYLMASKVR